MTAKTNLLAITAALLCSSVATYFVTSYKQETALLHCYVIRSGDSYAFAGGETAQNITDFVADVDARRQTIAVTWCGKLLGLRSTLDPAPVAHRMDDRSEYVKKANRLKNTPDIVRIGIVESHARAVGVDLQVLASGEGAAAESKIVYLNRHLLLLSLTCWIMPTVVVAIVVVRARRSKKSCADKVV